MGKTATTIHFITNISRNATRYVATLGTAGDCDDHSFHHHHRVVAVPWQSCGGGLIGYHGTAEFVVISSVKANSS